MAQASEVRVEWGKLEQVVGRLFQFARNAYLRVEELWHARAGRVRTEVRDSFHLKADRARLSAKGDLRLEGSTINLR